MALEKGTLTLCRYRAPVPRPVGLLLVSVEARQFRPIAGSEDLSVGWADPRDPLGPDSEKPWSNLDHYLVLAARVDRRRVPATVLKREARAVIAEELRRRDKLSRAQQEEIRERVRLDLLRRIPPESRVVDVVWALERDEVWFCASAQWLLAEVTELFQRTFDVPLLPVPLYFISSETLPRLEGLTPATLYTSEVQS